MNYAITGTADQALITDKLKSAGAKVIQSSNGLICKTPRSLGELKSLLSDHACQIEPVNDAWPLTPDVQKFLQED